MPLNPLDDVNTYLSAALTAYEKVKSSMKVTPETNRRAKEIEKAVDGPAPGASSPAPTGQLQFTRPLPDSPEQAARKSAQKAALLKK